jgi:hypothetical protein
LARIWFSRASESMRVFLTAIRAYSAAVKYQEENEQ